MSDLDVFYYDHQLRRYIVQFMAIFAGMKVSVGKSATKEERLITTPIALGQKDRVVAHIKGENTQNKPLRIPAFGANLGGIELAPELRKGVNQIRRNVIMPVGGLYPNDIEVVRQLMPVPYRAQMELAIFTSNVDQMHQLLEQILMLFDPILQLQTSDDVMDWTKITTCELTGIRFDDNYPSGADRRLVMTTLDFSMPVYIASPADIKDDYIKDIYLRIGAVSNSSITNQQMVDDLDGQGLDYELIFSADDIDIGD